MLLPLVRRRSTFSPKASSSPNSRLRVSAKSTTDPTLRANPYPEVTDLFCRLPFFYIYRPSLLAFPPSVQTVSLCFTLQALRHKDSVSRGNSTSLKQSHTRLYRHLTARYIGSLKVTPHELDSGSAFYSLPRTRLSRRHSPASGFYGRLAFFTRFRRQENCFLPTLFYQLEAVNLGDLLRL